MEQDAVDVGVGRVPVGVEVGTVSVGVEVFVG